MIFAAVLVVILVLVVAVAVGIARDSGPTPADVATSYEEAWDRLDFDALYAMSGQELRDGLERRAFVATKRAAYSHQPDLRSLASGITIVHVASSGETAIVVTEVVPHDGTDPRTALRNRIDLARRSGRWEVVGYRLAPPTGVATPAAG